MYNLILARAALNLSKARVVGTAVLEERLRWKSAAIYRADNGYVCSYHRGTDNPVSHNRSSIIDASGTDIFIDINVYLFIFVYWRQ